METNKALLDALMLNTGEAVLVTDKHQRIVKASRALQAATGQPLLHLENQPVSRLEELTGMPLSTMIGEVHTSGVARGSAAHPDARAYGWDYHLEPVHENGEVAWCLSILRPHGAQSNGEPTPPNRALFNDRLQQAITSAKRGNKAVLVMVVSIDRYREINDVLGEQTSAALLREIAERLRNCTRASDTVARLEEDRYAFIMQLASADDSVPMPEKIMSAFYQTFMLNTGKDVALSCSIGASLYPVDAANTDELLKNATVALHHAQHDGYGQSHFFSNEMNARARLRLEIESGIRRALAKGELRVYYQPKINVGTRKVAGMEALVRWQDPERGLVAPSEFIPVAEESGLIEQIGNWVLEETCAQTRRWQLEGLPEVRASVNVSARQFRNNNFVALVEQALNSSGLDPRWLELEITESMLMGDVNSIVARMQELRRTGVSLSIDDFGTGYSSLSYLSRFPVTTLKIDRAFVADVQDNPQTAEIARAIIGMSHGLNLEIVAEGAEVAEQIDFLQNNGCHLIQGYYYSKPLPATEFSTLLRHGLAPR